jgi:hypothetical protein
MSEHQQSLQPAFVPAKSAEIPSWKTVYEKTIWESDKEELLTLIHATEHALYLRWQELEDGVTHKQERAAMETAARELLAMKIHRLGWPNPCV